MDRKVYVAGFKAEVGDVEGVLKQFRKLFPHWNFQLFDAGRVAGRRHLEVAALYAEAAFKGGYAISRSLAIETALYASCQRQIGRALEMVGVRPETTQVALLSFEKDFFREVEEKFGWERDDSLLDRWAERLGELERLYGISEVELKAAMEGLEVDRAEAFLRLLWERMGLLASQV